MEIDKNAQIVDLTEDLMADYIPLYRAAYEAHPWHEELECACGATFAHGCEKMPNQEPCEQFSEGGVFLVRGATCKNCGRPLSELKPMWSSEVIVNDFRRHKKQKEFVSRGLRLNQKLEGSFQGFRLPVEDSHHVKYVEVGRLLRRAGIDPESNFYHCEIMIHPRLQGMGLGTVLLRESLLAIPQSLKTASYRTINPATTRCYEKVFKSKPKPVFRDPIKEKRQLWYVFSLDVLRNQEKQ
jgi:hypothetical protein